MSVPFFFKSTLRIFILCVITLLLLSVNSQIHAQTQVRILKSDQLMGADTDQGPIRKMIGNVELQTEDLHLFADSAYQYLEIDLVEAFGNIEIITERQRLWSDKVRYNTSTDESTFIGRVVIVTDNATIFSEEAGYDFTFEIATFPSKVRFEDEKGTLIAESGMYFNVLNQASFRGNIQLSDSTQYAEADSLFAIRNDNYYELHENVYIHDLENNSRLIGDYVESDSTGFRQISGNARVQRVSKNETDTTMIQAARFDILDREPNRIMNAFKNVEIWSEKYASLSDTTIYYDSKDEFHLIGNTRLWRNDLQLTSPKSLIFLIDDEIDNLESYTRPFVVFPDSITNRLNQIEGDTLRIWFSENEMKQLVMQPNSELIYHARDDNDEPESSIQLTSQFISMFFSEGDIDSLRILESIEGQYIPEVQNPAEIRLAGFVYTPDERPSKPEKWLLPRFEPIPEELPFPLPTRYLEYLRLQEEERQAEEIDD